MAVKYMDSFKYLSLFVGFCPLYPSIALVYGGLVGFLTATNARVSLLL
jgi:hypothetical protein